MSIADSHVYHPGECFYIVKWKDYPASQNTREPEAHLINNALLIAYWKRKKNKASPILVLAPHSLSSPLTPQPMPTPLPASTRTALPCPHPNPPLSHQAQLDRVTKLQEVARAEKEKRKTQTLSPGMESLSPDDPGPATMGPAPRPGGRPAQSVCKTTYDAAHAALPRAKVLVLDTETSGLAGCVLDLGWVLADSGGNELAAYSKLWRLPPGERIHSKALQAHGISAAEVQRDGVEPKPELQEFASLLTAALKAGVVVAAHNASFDVARLNHTALRHEVAVAPLRSAFLLCTMHNATKHCGLRKRGNKALKAPRNEELYMHLFKRKPTGRLHRALPDCRVTLACYLKGSELKWW